MDTRLFPPGGDKLRHQLPCHFGGLKEDWLMNSELIIVSPSISLSHPSLVLAAKDGIEIIGDIELFSRAVTSPIVAITGSNGKSTVTGLVGDMATIAGWKVGVGGNIGVPALTLLNHPYKLYILELSSFQLETTKKLKTAASTILNISEDHIDRYPLGLEQYRATKLKVYHDAEVCIFNEDDILTIPEKTGTNRYVSFGVNIGNYKISQQSGQTWLVAQGERLMNCAEMQVHGLHNYTNALAALALADVVGIPRVACLSALQKFSGLAHRLELVHERNGVRWINDSKSTNVASTKAALHGLKVDGTLHLLIGGDGKYADFSSLIPLLQGKRIRIYCFGQDGEKIFSLCPDNAILTKTLEQAMSIIFNMVKKGDVILLSPACSSLDQFENFRVRGEVFTILARKFG